MNKNDKIEKIFEYLGNKGDPDSFMLRVYLVDYIANIETKQYLGKILKYVGELSMQEHIDNEWDSRPEYQANTVEELERLEKLSRQKEGIRDLVSLLWYE